MEGSKTIAWTIACGNKEGFEEGLKERLKEPTSGVLQSADKFDTEIPFVLQAYKVVTRGKRKLSIPIMGATVSAVVWIDHRIIVGDGDFGVVGEIQSSSADSIAENKDHSIVVNGAAFKTGSVIRFYWSSGLMWGGVYEVETPDDKMIEFATPLDHPMPDSDHLLQFRSAGDGVATTVTAMSDELKKSGDEGEYITDNGYGDEPGSPNPA